MVALTFRGGSPGRVARVALSLRHSGDGSARDLVDHLAFNGAGGNRLPEERLTRREQASQYECALHFGFLRWCFNGKLLAGSCPAGFLRGN